MRLVAKIGTSSITDALGVIDTSVVDTLCDQLAALRAAGHEVILVSSGAVSAGVAALGMSARPTDMPTLQAISAAGQSRLMETYNRSLGAARSRRRAGAAGAPRLRRSPSVPPRPPDADPPARARLRPDRQRERRDRQPRAALRRQRSHRRARRPQRQRRSAGAAHRHARAVHRRPAHRRDGRADQRGAAPTIRCSQPSHRRRRVRAGAAAAWPRSWPRPRWPRGRAPGPSSPPPIEPMCWSTPLPA